MWNKVWGLEAADSDASVDALAVRKRRDAPPLRLSGTRYLVWGRVLCVR